MSLGISIDGIEISGFEEDADSYLGNPTAQANLPPPPPVPERRDQCTQVQITKPLSRGEGGIGDAEYHALKSIYRYQAHYGHRNRQTETTRKLTTPPPKEEEHTKNETLTTNNAAPSSNETDARKILMPLYPVKHSLPNLGTATIKVDNVDVTRYQILLFGGIDPYGVALADQQGKTVLQYNIKTNSWKTITNMPGSRHHHSAVLYSGKIFIIGGTRPAYESLVPILSESVWSFDYTTLQWRKEKDLPFPRRDFGLVATKSGLFIIGGEDSNREFLSSTIMLPPGENQDWVEVAGLRTPRTGLTAALVGDNILAAGGIVGPPNIGVTDTVESYNITAGYWTTVSKLRKPRSFGKLCVLSDCSVFIVGGVTVEGNKFFSFSSIDRLDPKTKEWKKETNLTFARHGHDAVVLEEKILIFGGVSTNRNLALESVECYSTANKKWIMGMRPLPTPLSGMAAVIYLT